MRFNTPSHVDVEALNSLVNALKQPEVEVVKGLMGSAGVVDENQPGGIRLPHLSTSEHERISCGRYSSVSSLLPPPWMYLPGRAPAAGLCCCRTLREACFPCRVLSGQARIRSSTGPAGRSPAAADDTRVILQAKR